MESQGLGDGCMRLSGVHYPPTVDRCARLNPSLDIPLVCFRGLLVPAVRELGKL